MGYGIIGFGQPGTAVSTAQVGTSQMLPSGTIWGDCQSQEMTDEGTGFFVAKDFVAEVTLPGLPNQNGTWSNGSGDDHSANVAVTSTANAAAFTRPLAPVVANGNSKMWFEAAISPAQITNQAIFVGLANSTGLSSTLLATSTTLTSAGVSLIGFWLHGDAPSNFDAIYQKAGGSPQTVLASVLTANANNPNPANVNYVPATPPGALTGSNYVKLGIRTDKTYVYFYVNGTQVAKKQLDSTFDQTSSYGGIVTIGTQTANTDNLKIGFFRCAGKINGQV